MGKVEEKREREKVGGTEEQVTLFRGHNAKERK